MSEKPSFTSEYEEIARKVWRVFRRTHGLNSYASILALAAWERIGKFTRNDTILEESKQLAAGARLPAGSRADSGRGG